MAEEFDSNVESTDSEDEEGSGGEGKEKKEKKKKKKTITIVSHGEKQLPEHGKSAQASSVNSNDFHYD